MKFSTKDNEALILTNDLTRRRASSHRLASAQKILSNGMEEDLSGEYIICNIDDDRFNRIKDDKIRRIIEKTTAMRLNESTPEMRIEAFHGRNTQPQEFLSQFEPCWSEYENTTTMAGGKNNLKCEAYNWFRGAKGVLFYNYVEFFKEIEEIFTDEANNVEKFELHCEIADGFKPAKNIESLIKVYAAKEQSSTLLKHPHKDSSKTITI